MDIFIKQKWFNQFYVADCVIIRTKGGNVRVIPLSVEHVSGAKYYRQEKTRRVILPVNYSNFKQRGSNFFINGDVFISGTADYNFFDSIAKSMQ